MSCTDPTHPTWAHDCAVTDRVHARYADEQPPELRLADTPALREKILIALCTDHGHVMRRNALNCRTCIRRTDDVLAALREHAEQS